MGGEVRGGAGGGDRGGLLGGVGAEGEIWGSRGLRGGARGASSGPGSGSGVGGGSEGVRGFLRSWRRLGAQVPRGARTAFSKAPVAARAGAPGLPEPAPPTPGEGGGGGGGGAGRGRPRRLPSPCTRRGLLVAAEEEVPLLTDPSGGNSGRGGRCWEGSGILDADALRASRRVGSVGALAGSLSPGPVSGGAGVRALLPAFRPARLLRLPGEAGDPPPGWLTSEEPLIFRPPRLRDSAIEAPEELE